MTTQLPLGPSGIVLAMLVARRYYLEGRTKTEIANELRLSRFKVARLLDAAHDQGLVKIEISYHGAINVEMSAQLRDTFGMHNVVVVDTPEVPQDSLRRQLGRAAADLLSETVTQSDVLGLVWSRSVSAMAAELKQLPPIQIIQLTGVLAHSNFPDEDNSIDLVREVARIAGGSSRVFFAPFLVADPPTAQTLRRQPDVERAFSRIPSVTKAVIGLGRWSPGQSTIYDAASHSEQRALTAQGVCAEVGGVFLTADGQPVHTSLNDRMVGIDASQMQSIPEVMAIAYGVHKQPAVKAALRSGLVNSLVTETSLADALLREADTGPGNHP